MNNNNDNQNINGQVTINAQYVKDLSFESPNAPLNFGNLKSQPAIELHLDLAAKAVQENIFEVAMQIKAKAASEDKTLFVIELTYGGLFTLENIEEPNREFILLVQCPSIIFPFARRIIADVTRDGGFQPLMIDPVDFASLYMRKKQSGNEPTNLTGMPNYN